MNVPDATDDLSLPMYCKEFRADSFSQVVESSVSRNIEEVPAIPGAGKAGQCVAGLLADGALIVDSLV